MTKEEYIQSVCNRCPHYPCGWVKRNQADRCLEIGLATDGWDACEESLKERATALYKEGKIDSYALGLLFKEEQHPVDAGRAKAKEKH